MEPKKTVGVIVMGDIGRSPRMQYHSLSLAREGFSVDVIGYAGSEPIPALKERENVNFRFVRPSPELKGWPGKIGLPVKVIWQFFTLSWVLMCSPRYDFLLLQNPPAVPAMVVCWLYSVFVRSRFIIDWHNYGFSILSLSLGPNHPFVRLYKFIERQFSRGAYAHFCVTKAMKNDLQKNWNISAVVLYDRPPDMFHPISIEEKHELFSRLSVTYPELQPSRFILKGDNAAVKDVDNRPGILVSSTSWTEDEDFSILISALEEYENQCEAGMKLPNLVCVVTGKGPLKQTYCDLIKSKSWKNIQCVTPWLEPEDYPKLLASADLGICLHTSSSGLDLPMKVVDMFGCCLPVCAFRYPCLDELVKDGVNGLVFDDGPSLSSKLILWFTDFPSSNRLSEKFRSNLRDFQKVRWQENWTMHARPIFCSS